MAYGDKEGAIGYLIGEENRGLEYMFIMMNAARFAVGMEGVAVAEAAYQKALAYAKERVQSRELGGSGSKAVPIIRHPDVRRMLMSMKAQAEATRALAYVVAGALDKAHHHPDKDERARAQGFVDLMIPIVKGWSTETSIDVASLGIQVHGGMGFIEETGAAQFLRDARITTIYEGTTGIQANDLIGRKVARESGATAKAVLEAIGALDADAREDRRATGLRGHPLAPCGGGDRRPASPSTGSWRPTAPTRRRSHAGAVPFLKLMGIVCGGWQMARAAVAAQAQLARREGDAAFLKAKIGTARFFADHFLSQAPRPARCDRRGRARRAGARRGAVLARGRRLQASVAANLRRHPDERGQFVVEVLDDAPERRTFRVGLDAEAEPPRQREHPRVGGKHIAGQAPHAVPPGGVDHALEQQPAESAALPRIRDRHRDLRGVVVVRQRIASPRRPASRCRRTRQSRSAPRRGRSRRSRAGRAAPA